MSNTNNKKAEYRDKNLGHEPVDVSHQPNLGDELAARQQGQSANANAGETTVHLQSKLRDLPAISRENSQLGVRVRKPNSQVGMGSHVTSEAPKRGEVGGGREASEAAKEKNFGYLAGDSSRKSAVTPRRGNPSNLKNVPRVEVGHDRNWNQEK